LGDKRNERKYKVYTTTSRTFFLLRFRKKQHTGAQSQILYELQNINRKESRSEKFNSQRMTSKKQNIFTYGKVNENTQAKEKRK
jgi:hypothetical protein